MLTDPHGNGQELVGGGDRASFQGLLRSRARPLQEPDVRTTFLALTVPQLTDASVSWALDRLGLSHLGMWDLASYMGVTLGSLNPA